MKALKKLWRRLTRKTVHIYVDPDVVGGRSDGSTWENAYSNLASTQINGQNLYGDNIQLIINMRKKNVKYKEGK